MRKSFFALNLDRQRSISYILVVSASLSLASCSTVLNNLPGVYSIDVQQGNIVDQAMIDQLRPSMNKRQVLYIMGSPMLVNFFHQKRWDYLYTERSGDEAKEQKRISLFFNNDQLAAVQGDLKPSAVPVIKTSNETTVDVPKRDLEKTMWEKITGLFGYDGIDSPAKTNPADAAVSTDKLPF
ncbi:MAG: outer membrane protein assembly factor BamE [Methylobacter sp.]|jgi:outer membrane protein assembly factor BamE|nr:outer membrane protein assembly factor BamE [Methylobacter sp.]